MEIVHYSARVPDTEFVVELAKKVGARVVVPVLPLSIVAGLVDAASKDPGLTVLYAQMREVCKGGQEQCERIAAEKPDRCVVVEYAHGVCRVFEFVQFERVKAVKLETEPL
ncbi:MAG: hypothetical protein QXT28_12365 [Thermofilaceae archaeon]